MIDREIIIGEVVVVSKSLGTYAKLQGVKTGMIGSIVREVKIKLNGEYINGVLVKFKLSNKSIEASLTLNNLDYWSM